MVETHHDSPPSSVHCIRFSRRSIWDQYFLKGRGALFAAGMCILQSANDSVFEADDVCEVVDAIKIAALGAQNVPSRMHLVILANSAKDGVSVRHVFLRC